METDPRRVIVTENSCYACSVYTIRVHHAHFPELRFVDISAEHLVNRLEAQRGTTSDPSHREALRQAIDDVRAFRDPEGPVHLGRDAQGYPPQS
jgi:hypothetical protein